MGFAGWNGGTFYCAIAGQLFFSERSKSVIGICHQSSTSWRLASEGFLHNRHELLPFERTL